MSSLLSLVGTVTTTSISRRFVAKENFVIGISNTAKVRIADIGENFKAWFLNGEGKVENTRNAQIVHYYRLRTSLVDDHAIISELGGQANAETTLSEMHYILENYNNGKNDVLQCGRANLFYIPDQYGVLRVVDLYWLEIGWYIYARSINNPRKWRDGDQVFSHHDLNNR